MSAVLSPSTIATTFVSLDEGTDADIAVRRYRGTFLRRWAFNLLMIALLVAIVPMIVVMIRREPSYFTNGVVITMLIVAAVILVVGLLVAFLWSKSSAGRREFDEPFIRLNASGLTMSAHATGLPEKTVPWDNVRSLRLIGADDLSLAITIDDDPAGPTAISESAKAQASEAQETGVRGPELGDSVERGPDSPTPIDIEYTPPDRNWQPSKADFEAISVAPEVSEPLNDEATAEEPGAKKSRSMKARAGKAAKNADSREGGGEHWRQALYGTPYVVELRGCKPPLSEIRPTVHNLSRGRLTIPTVSEGALGRWFREKLARSKAA